MNFRLKKELIVTLFHLGDQLTIIRSNLLIQLRNAGFTVEKDYLDRKVKAQFKSADRLEAKYVAYLGEDELEE